MAVTRKVENNKYWWGCRELRTSDWLVEMKIAQLLWTTAWKLNVELPSDPAIPLPREVKKMSTHNFVRNVHSSIIHKRKQGQQPSVHGQMVDKQCGTSFSLKQGKIVMMTS